MDSADEKNLGTQPLDQILAGRGLKNSDLVDASTEQLTHKMVAKARKGRRLSPNVRLKVLNALNALEKDKPYRLSDLFNY
jgi:hypothetical protein